ncbi:MAG: hypothetical protein AB2A00_39630 [Myxococcota bacterium]
MMRAMVMASALAVMGAACGPQEEDNACGLKKALPDTPSGTLQATRDGQPYTANSGIRGYRLTDRFDIVAGDVTLNIPRDKDGKRVDEAVNAGNFPVCIVLKSQQAGNPPSYAFVNAGGNSYVTDDTHGGTVAILAKEGDELVGRFEFEAVQNSGSGTTKFEDGSFRLGPR